MLLLKMRKNYLEVKNLKIKTRLFAVIFAILLLSPLLFTPIASATNELASAPLILKLGDDDAIDYTIEKIMRFAPMAKVVSIENLNALKSTSRSFGGYTIYVGHGEKAGLVIGENIVPWKDVKAVIENAPITTYMVASCYSSFAKVDGKVTYSFDRPIDVDEAAMYAVILYYSYAKEFAKVPQAIDYFTSVIMDKYRHPEQNFIATLDYSDNSYSRLGIWWNKYSDDPQYPIRYTHPDYYNEWAYPAVGTESEWSIWGDSGVGAVHIPASVLLSYQIGTAIAYVATGAGIAAFVTGGISIIVGAIVAIAGLAEDAIIEYIVKSEAGDGWCALKTPAFEGCPPWYLSMLWEFKLGGFCWFDFLMYINNFPVPYVYFWCFPTGIGGAYLGIEDI